MDIAITNEAFSTFLSAAEIENGFGCGRQVNDFKDLDMRHRHLSHLFGLFLGYTITLKETPALFEAAQEDFINEVYKLDQCLLISCVLASWDSQD
ncbi:hypothetical protein RJT34_12592 [Clitoria ternatea]|uniref:Glycosyl hydrolase family 95 catalytic domain-containing protein n=1 Tax=Clitoria ternatea TaxID=43366 RepID=A0AAN9JM25_CLITE